MTTQELLDCLTRASASPDKLLEGLAELLSRRDNEGLLPSHEARVFGHLFATLDEHLRNGGELPEAWRPKRDTAYDFCGACDTCLGCGEFVRQADQRSHKCDPSLLDDQ
jgi:hypothetical protein